MRSPLFFFIIVFVIDLVLKSAKNKKKVEQARRKRTAEIKPVESKGRSIMQTIREEIEKEVQKESEKKDTGKRMLNQSVYKEDQIINHKSSLELMKETEIKKRTQWSEDIFARPTTESHKIEVEREESLRVNSLRKDFIRGIVFSEIISEPKSIKNQRKSM